MWDLSSLAREGLNLCPLLWKVDSKPLDQQGSLSDSSVKKKFHPPEGLLTHKFYQEVLGSLAQKARSPIACHPHRVLTPTHTPTHTPQLPAHGFVPILELGAMCCNMCCNKTLNRTSSRF